MFNINFWDKAASTALVLLAVPVVTMAIVIVWYGFITMIWSLF